MLALPQSTRFRLELITRMPLLSGLLPHHFSVAVTDMEKAISWYGEVLGFQLEMRFHVPGIPADGAFLNGPGIRLELWCAHGVAAVPAQRRIPDEDLRTAGTKHLAFAIDDLQLRLPDLMRHGVDIAAIQRQPTQPMRPESDPLAPGLDPVFAMFIRDPFGTLIELLDRQRVAH